MNGVAATVARVGIARVGIARLWAIGPCQLVFVSLGIDEEPVRIFFLVLLLMVVMESMYR